MECLAENKPISKLSPDGPYEKFITRAALENDIDRAFIKAVIEAESDGDPNLAAAAKKGGAVSVGLMQLIDSDAKDIGLDISGSDLRKDPEINIVYTTRFIKKFDIGARSGPSRRVGLVAARYNKGAGITDLNVFETDIYPYKYSRRVFALYIAYRSQYLLRMLKTQPRLAAYNDFRLAAATLDYYSRAFVSGTSPLLMRLEIHAGDSYERILNSNDVDYDTAKKIGTQYQFDAPLPITPLTDVIEGNTPAAASGAYPESAGEGVLKGPEAAIDKFQTFTDHIEQDKRNRLVAAFPTYCVMIYDGGRWLGYYRFFDRFFGHQGVSDIEVFRSRLSPAHVAKVTFSNMYGRLTSQLSENKVQNDYANLRWTAAWTGQIIENLVDPKPNKIYLEKRAQALNSLLLKPGARMHIRLGYGSDAGKLPIAFNGTITDVPLEEGWVQVIALGDGAELLKRNLR